MEVVLKFLQTALAETERIAVKETFPRQYFRRLCPCFGSFHSLLLFGPWAWTADRDTTVKYVCVCVCVCVALHIRLNCAQKPAWFLKQWDIVLMDLRGYRPLSWDCAFFAPSGLQMFVDSWDSSLCDESSLNLSKEPTNLTLCKDTINNDAFLGPLRVRGD